MAFSEKLRVQREGRKGNGHFIFLIWFLLILNNLSLGKSYSYLKFLSSFSSTQSSFKLGQFLIPVRSFNLLVLISKISKVGCPSKFSQLFISFSFKMSFRSLLSFKCSNLVILFPVKFKNCRFGRISSSASGLNTYNVWI